MPKLPTVTASFEFTPSTPAQYREGVAKIRMIMAFLEGNLKTGSKYNKASFFIDGANKKI